MKLRNKRLWYNAWLQNWRDGYGKAVLRYARRWADMMEQRIEEGDSIAKAAEATQYEANTEGITGFMHSLAVQVLADVWQHGDELLTWHNRKTAPNALVAEDATQKGLAANGAVVTLGKGRVSPTPRITLAPGTAALNSVLGGGKPRWPWQRLS